MFSKLTYFIYAKVFANVHAFYFTHSPYAARKANLLKFNNICILCYKVVRCVKLSTYALSLRKVSYSSSLASKEVCLRAKREKTDTAKNKGYDEGKKVSGIKRHLAVDTAGLTHAIGITTADVTDKNGALEILATHKKSLSNVTKVIADCGYTGKNFANSVKEILGSTVEIAKRNELHKFEGMPKRWIVERSFAWLQKCRRLWKNCERKLNSSLLMTLPAFLSLLLTHLTQA